MLDYCGNDRGELSVRPLWHQHPRRDKTRQHLAALDVHEFALRELLAEWEAGEDGTSDLP